MNLRQLELFVAIAETGSFSRGAEKVSLTQSTASQHIAALEAEVDTILFDRTGKGAFLTPGGKLFMQHARRVLSERDGLFQSMAGFKGLEDARLTIGASNIPANYLIPLLLPQLKQEHRGISLTVITGDTSDILHRLDVAEVELAVVGNRLDQPGIDYRPLLNDRLDLIVGPGHRWFHERQISLQDLISEPLVVRESGSGSGQSLERALRQAGHDPAELKIAARLGSNEAVLQAVAAGFGCAFVSELSVRHHLDGAKLRKVDVKGLTVDRQIWLAKLHTRTSSPAARAFTELLVKNYSGQS